MIFINPKCNIFQDCSNRPTYSEIAAKSSGNESDPSPLCNGNAGSSSEEDANKAYRKTFSEVITAQQDLMKPSPTDNVTASRKSESSDQSAQSPTTPKNEVVRSETEEVTWTKSTYRNPRPKNVNSKNVYKLETKLNDLDISEPVFPTAPVEPDSASVNKESDLPNTPSSADIITPRNKPFKAAINWFDDDEEDDFLEDNSTYGEADCDLSNDLAAHSDVGHVANDTCPVTDDCHVAEDCINLEETEEEIEPVKESNSADNCVQNSPPRADHDLLENGLDEGEAGLAAETLTPGSPAESHHSFKSPCALSKPEIFHLEDPPKGQRLDAEETASLAENKDEDSDYDSERDEFYSSYCESPGWE